MSQIMPPEMVPVKSSNIKAVGYRATEELLFVAFLGGDKRPDTLYRYEKVSPIIHQSLMNASSIGGYFAKYIKDNPLFPCTKIG